MRFGVNPYLRVLYVCLSVLMIGCAPAPRPVAIPLPAPVVPDEPLFPAEDPVVSTPTAPILPQFDDPLYGPDVLVVGDSQISFGAGKEHLAFFSDLQRHCGAGEMASAYLDNLNARSVAAIGVRSTSLQHWSSTDNAGKALICDKDEKFGVNAATYGVSGSGRSYVQIGEGEPYQFCKAGQSPLRAMFAPGYYDPKLLVLAFLGNAADRWAKSPAAAASDLNAALGDVPSNTACIVMTTAPSYLADVNEKRGQAQENLQSALAASNMRCSFVSGVNSRTRAANTGNKAHFKTNSAGVVTDPYHPNAAAFSEFFELMKPQLCRAVLDQIGPLQNIAG